ncbi:hypothetical protein R3I93_008191 [Phoxinus phoxinus]|uniref:Uncharacterized protein n=1 Tax=Phoxinus phoxinus TaxID=58324 RepID=A0AAN9D640_9TELE
MADLLCHLSNKVLVEKRSVSCSTKDFSVCAEQIFVPVLWSWLRFCYTESSNKVSGGM